MRFSTSLAPVTAAALAASVLTVAPLAATAAESAPVVQSGSVNWPLKSSFLNYVQGFARGEINVSDGATKTPATGKTTGFDLPVNAAKSKLDAQGNGTINLDGKIQFYGHKGLGPNRGWGLDLSYEDFKVQVDGKKVTFTADYEANGELPGGKKAAVPKADDAVIAVYELENPITPVAGAEVTGKTKEGRLGKGGFDSLISYSETYKPEADAFNYTLKFGEKQNSAPTSPATTTAPKPSDPTTTQPAPTTESGSSLSTGSIIGIVIAAIALIGGGLFFAWQNFMPR